MTLPPARRPQGFAYETTPRVEPFHPNVIYLCQICSGIARYPRPKAHTFHFPWGRSWTVTYVTPMVCLDCRMNPTVVQGINQGEHRRRFWKRFFALYLGERYPSMGPRMQRLVDLRIKLWGKPHA